jgi:TPP-dependent 2-oxoacid decarboxylase
MAEIKIGEYIFKRLRELGIETVFGVPGGTLSLGSGFSDTDFSQTMSSHSSILFQALVSLGSALPTNS